MQRTIRSTGTGVLVVAALLIAGCGAAPATQEVPADPFVTTLSLGGEARTIGISGDSAGHRAGETSEFELTLDNLAADGPWQGEYCVLLVDGDGVVARTARGQFSVPAGATARHPITVDFPVGFEGPLGLCVVISDYASVVTTVWVGADRTDSAGPWPDIRSCP